MDTTTIAVDLAKSVFHVAVSRRPGHVCENHRLTRTRFPSGRHFASYLGLTPREHSSGLQRRLGRISKRGDSYIRMLLVHGARSVLWASMKSKNPDRLRSWALEIEHTRGHNKAAVALANKLARIVWTVWKGNRSFESIKGDRMN